jgi:hypothetical protein
MGLPFIGSSIDDPSFLRRSNCSSLDSRTNRSLPNTPKNIFPLTNAEMLPNIGRTVTRPSLGTRDWKRSTDSLSGRGIFNRPTQVASGQSTRVEEVSQSLLAEMALLCLGLGGAIIAFSLWLSQRIRKGVMPEATPATAQGPPTSPSSAPSVSP